MSWGAVAVGALWVATVGQTVFVVVYACRPWWRHFVGRALFTKSVSLAAVLWATLLPRYWDYPFRLQVMAVLTGVVAAAILAQTVALFAQQHIDRRTGA